MIVDLPFARSFVLNHRGDEGRWNAFLAENRWQRHAPRLTRVPVIDPVLVRPPRHWRGTPSQWARLRGVLAVLETCLDQNIPCAMVFDDGARFTADGPARFERFMGQLPIDWKLLIFGGRHQHLRQGVPTKVDEHVYRPFSVTAPCAFMWRGRPMLRKLYDFCLQSCTALVGPRDYCEIRRPEARCMYVPDEWVFRLSDAASDRGGESTDRRTVADGAARLWNVQWPQTMVAVLGHYRGGSSCVAGVLHQLGVSMGEKLLPPDRLNPHGYFECLRLHRLCHRFFDHPSLARRLPSPQMIGLLRQWAYHRSLANPQASFLGAKHPSLCCLGEDLAAAWPRRRFIVVDRPPDEIVASILRTDWGWNREEAALAVATTQAQREQFLAHCDPAEVLRLDFHQLLIHPHQEIHRLAAHLAVALTPHSLAASLRHVVR
ncbi:MAG: sulfotransferase [Planctomycetota bacterium]|nr:sulfotransferase [Planctomycetota bacterium]